MKYIKITSESEKVEVGSLIEEWGEFEFTAQNTYDDYESAANELVDSNQKYRTLSEVYTIPQKFLFDLVNKANRIRQQRDSYAEKAGIVVTCHSYYEYNHNNYNLECYSSDFGSTFEYKGNTESDSLECRQFWSNHNYLCGIADGIWELGFTLCWDAKNKTHIIKGKCPELVITPAKEM